MSDAWEEDECDEQGVSFSAPSNSGNGYRESNGDGEDRGYNGRGRSNDEGFKKGGFRNRNDGGGDRNRNDGGGDRRRNENGDSNGFRKRNQEDGEEEGCEEKTEKKEFYIPPETDAEDLFQSNISTGINFGKYDHIPVQVTGENAPPAISSFEDCDFSDLLMENIKRSSYTIPTPIQKNGIPIIQSKRDLMACAQTGSGKTAAFLLPIISSLLKSDSPMSIGKPHALIISPTRELAIQIYDEAKKFSHRSFIKVVIAYGGTASGHQSENISKGAHIVVATPGRLLDFVNRGFITFEDIKFVVLDEADRMLDLGFMPSVEKVLNHPTMSSNSNRQTLMFSATFPEEIQRAAGRFLENYIFIAVGIVGSACSDVEQRFYEVTKFEKRQKLIDLLEEEVNPKGILVFVETKRNADFLASLLSETKFLTTSIHGDRMQREREEALHDFKTGKMVILVATSVAARGLDIKNVTHVINYDLPKSIDEYVHRIGRTGRVGNKGRATSFFDAEQDLILAGNLVKILQQAEQEIPSFLENVGASATTHGNGGGPGFASRDVRHHQSNGSNKPSMPTADEEDENW